LKNPSPRIGSRRYRLGDGFREGEERRGGTETGGWTVGGMEELGREVVAPWRKVWESEDGKEHLEQI